MRIAWQTTTPQIGYYLALGSGDRLGFDPRKHSFVLPSKLAREIDECRQQIDVGQGQKESSVVRDDENTSDVPVIDVFVWLLTVAAQNRDFAGKSRIHLLPDVTYLILTALPVIISAMVGAEFVPDLGPTNGGQILPICFLVLWIVNCRALAVSSCHFPLFTAFDFQRRFLLLLLLGSLIDDQTWVEQRVKENFPNFERKFFDLTIPQNIASWQLLRILIMDHGQHFKQRVVCYSTMFTVAILMLIAFLSFEILTNNLTVEVFSSAYADTHEQYIKLTMLAEILVLIAVISFAFCMALIVGTKVNFMSIVHRNSLTHLSFIMAEIKGDLDGSDGTWDQNVETDNANTRRILSSYRILKHFHLSSHVGRSLLVKLEHASNQLRCLERKLLLSDQIEPLKIFGVRVSQKILVSVTSLSAAGASFLLLFFFGGLTKS
mmetsp:Transcript_37383/g.73525  ORF Transcript_37383/g.73525 Transcript_37383/m.73525 type:complete len:434 (+) Transcript_37383:504-1805(+)|eukprot:CAMPEP_0175122246 /NCGR_PEP_ID=MMETSP0087-20121206/1616_1 /TAXON_ID=136419 /ORGANISM="Unknown Unknown, Strain D1" /LENGTH=433 /DNA_ID=CAMNT_0016403875 /DNA_START=486 /DNA_END=1787 /DNA_ORIENTATION=-